MKSNSVYLSVKDHSVSGEEFQLLYNEELEMLQTHPQPSEEYLPEYYKSEDYISHTDAKRNWLEKVYHIAKTIALKQKLKLINSFDFEEKQLLDIGCGTGDFLKIAKDDQWDVFGVEPNSKARQIANQKTNNSVVDTNQLLQLTSNRFDVITLWHVLEHLPKLEEQIAQFESFLKPNGRLVIAVPNYKSFDAHYYQQFWAAFDVPRHLWHFSQESISRLVQQNGMQIIETKPMIFDAYYVSLLSEKYRNGVMNPFKAFWIGLRSNIKAKRSGEYSSLLYIIKKK